jgi:hypothetical protein
MTASIISGVNLLVLNVPPPLEQDGITLRDDLLGLKVWYSLTPNFDELTEGVLAYDGAGLSATIAGLTPGINYYVKYALISDIDPSVYDISEELVAQATSRDEVPDPTPPPTPTGVSVSAGITSVIISHDTPEYTVGNGHRRTLVYGKIRAIGAPLPTYNDNDIRVIVEFTGSITSFATEPGTTWHLWLKWLSNDGVLSEIPSGGTNGHVAITGQDVSKLLDVLAGEITESQLYSDLTSRIDLIDDPTTGLVKKTDDLVITYGTTASAAASAASAAQAAADAIVAKGLAEGSANTATTQAGLATTAKNAAATSATNASQSASAAATSATNAAGSASTATTQAGLATTAKNAAATSATNASQSASAAATSATSAAGSASTATTQAGLATTAKNAAGTSATNASQSASAAATSASNAAGSASTATTQAELATSAKNAAGTSATNASQSASAAATSASNAAGSASTATTQVGLATSAKDAAAASATNASQSASAAATSATSAAGSASTATTQVGLATTAKDAAATSATNASQSASAAATSATNAAGSASTATTQAGLATTAKNAAATSATNASQSATAAATSATNAAGSASTATTQASIATNAKNDATGAATSAGVFATNSATSATNAATSAASAASSLQQVQSAVRASSFSLPLEQWVLNGQTIVDITDGKVGTKTLRLSGPGGYPNQGNYVAIDPTKKYRVKFWARPSSTTTGTLYFSLRQFLDEGTTPGPVNGGRSPYKPAGVSRAQHNTTYGTGQWGEYNYVWDVNNWQTGVKFVQPEFLDNYSDQSTGHWDIQAFSFTDVTQTEDLTAVVQTLATTTAGPDGTTAQYTVKTDVNGYVAGFGLSNTVNTAGVATSEFTIVADKFAIATVNTSNTAADGSPFFHRTAPTTINGVVIPAGTYMKSAFIHDATITTAKIANLAVDNAKIANLAVDNAKIANLAVDNAKIANLAVDNAKIANLNADKITAGFINADRIAAGSITASKINTNGLEVRDNAGNLLLGSGGLTMQGLGGNLLRNSGFEDGIGGYVAGYWTTSVTPVVGWNFDSNFNLRGKGLAYIRVTAVSAVGQVFDFVDTAPVPVTPNTRYEAHALLNTHRCSGQVVLAWFDSNLTYINEIGGNTVTYQTTVFSLTDLRQSGVFAVSPPNAVYCRVIARGLGLGQSEGFVFVKNMYLGQATSTQVEYTAWSPGQGLARGIGQITALNASTYISDAAIGSAQIGSLSLTGTNNFSVKSATAGARVEMDSRVIKVFDTSGVLRVQIGDLTL